jgi:SAM-dependent methyltransferase
MSLTELAFLKTNEARQLIADNAQTDPSVFALKNRNPTLATQLKYIQRSRVKLPSLFKVQAIVPPLAFEQCSSELAASAKEVSGKRCLDLTCGLGIDTQHFAQYFEEVISVEQNEVLAEVVRYNLDLLNIKNVKILTDSAENYLKNYVGEPFDFIFIDPARRDNIGKKVFLPEDCSPNIVQLLPKLKEIGKRILINMSPMYDVDAAIRQFPDLTSIYVLSINNECKEVLLNFDSSLHTKKNNVLVMVGSEKGFLTFEKKEEQPNYNPKAQIYTCIIEPDVAFYKARFLPTFFAYFADAEKAYLTASNGFVLSTECPVLEHQFREMGIPASRVFKILEVFDYQPKKIIERLKLLKINALNVVQRNFPFTTQQVRTALKLKEGGELFLICTLVDGKKVAYLAERH